MIFITRNGKQEGPYSEDEVKKKLISNRFAVNSLARREGDSEWTPLSHLLNLSALLEVDKPTRGKRPALVWFISILYITFYALIISVFAWLRCRMSPQEWKNEQGQAIGEMLSTNHLAQMFISSILAIVAAILLLRLKRRAVYFFVAVFAIDITQTIYYTFNYGWRSAIGYPPTFPIIVWSIQIAVILYSIRLIKSGVLN